MIRYLARKCSYCGQVVKVQMEGSKIIHIEGARPLGIWSKNKFTKYLLAQSHKTLLCQGEANPTEVFDYFRLCNRQMYISTFKEIKG